MEKNNQHNWNNVKVDLKGKEIDNKSIFYTQEEFQTLLFETPNGVKMNRIPSMEFYLKRKNKYYFKNQFGARFFIETDEMLPFKKGDKFNIAVNSEFGT